MDAPYGAPGPASLAGGGKHARPHEPSGDAAQGRSLLQVPGEHLAHDGRLVLLHPQTLRVTGTFRIGPVTEWHPHPRQELPGAQLRQPPAAHPLGDEGPLVFGHRSPYLQQELVVRVLAHGPLQELYPTAASLQFFEEQHLVDVLAGEPVGGGDEDHLELGHSRSVAQGVESGAVQARAAVALVEVDAPVVEGPPLLLRVVLKPCDLLVGLAVPRLARGGYPGVDRRAHQAPPSSSWFPSVAPNGGGAGRPGPSDGRRRRERPSCVEPSSSLSSIPPRRTPFRGGYPRRLGRSFSRLRRVKQNLSFMISPSKRSSKAGSLGATAARDSRSSGRRRRR